MKRNAAAGPVGETIRPGRFRQIRGTEGIRDHLDVKSSQMVWS